MTEEKAGKAKEWSFRQKGDQAAATKADEEAWRALHANHRRDFLAKAHKNKAEAAASRARARALRDGLESQRRLAAAEQRKIHNANRLAMEAFMSKSGTGTKSVHDAVYKKKFVSASLARRFSASPFADVVDW